MSTTAYIILAFSNLIEDYIGFIIALIGAFIMGIAFALGELTMLGMNIYERENFLVNYSSAEGNIELHNIHS